MDVPCLNKTNTRDSVLKITKTPEPTSGNTYPFFVFNPVPTAVPPCASCSSEAAISKNQKSGSKEVAEKSTKPNFEWEPDTCVEGCTRFYQYHISPTIAMLH